MKAFDYVFTKRFLESTMEHIEDISYIDLFRDYSRVAISSPKDYKDAIHYFSHFAMRVLESKGLSEENFADQRKKLIEQCSIIRRFLKPSNIVQQETFGDIASKFAKKLRCKSVLDVGAGEVPHSSIVIAEKIDDVTAFDRYKFLLSKESLENMGVKTREGEYFTRNTNVSGVDIIVGRYPCTAIEEIVRIASKRNKPYFIEHCNCGMPFKKDKNGHIVGWKEILTDIDKNIVVDEKYAYNMDISKKQFDKVVSKFTCVEPQMGLGLITALRTSEKEMQG